MPLSRQRELSASCTLFLSCVAAIFQFDLDIISKIELQRNAFGCLFYCCCCCCCYLHNNSNSSKWIQLQRHCSIEMNRIKNKSMILCILHACICIQCQCLGDAFLCINARAQLKSCSCLYSMCLPFSIYLHFADAFYISIDKF